MDNNFYRPMRSHLKATFGLVLLLFCLAAQKKETPATFSPKFVPMAQVGQALCEQAEGKSTDFTEALWSVGFNIAQVEGATIEFNGPASSMQGYAFAQGKAVAQQHRHRFFSFGFCSNKRAWYASFPVVANITIKNDIAFLDYAHLNVDCAKIDIAFAERDSSKIRELAIEGKGSISLKDFPPGFLGVTCTPKTAGEIGPQLMYLASFKTNYQQALKGLDLKGDNLLTWINNTRKNLKLSELKDDSELAKLASSFVKAQSLAHFHKISQEQTEKLRGEQGYQDLRELKARGKSLEEVKKFLWLSPFHRAALIEPESNKLGLGETKDKGTYSVVIFTANKKPKL